MLKVGTRIIMDANIDQLFKNIIGDEQHDFMAG